MFTKLDEHQRNQFRHTKYQLGISFASWQYQGMNMTLRWSARVLSILVVALLLVFACGEGLNLSRFTVRELLLFAFFPLGLCVGMVVAWRREILGGCITVAS